MSFRPKPLLGKKPKKGHPLASGLVGCWVMNERGGDIVYDLSRNGLNGTPTGTSWVSNGLYFDGANGVAVIFDTIPTLGSNYSIVSGIKSNVVNENNCIASLRSTTASNPLKFQLDHNNADVRLLVRDDSGVISNSTYSSALSVGVVANVAGVVTGNTVQAFVNGIGAASDTDAKGAITVDKFLIGGLVSGSETITYVFKGTIYYIYLYNRALTPVEIAWLHREPYAMFRQDMSLLALYTASLGVILKYRTGATSEACQAAEWQTYTGSFNSLGYVQARVEAA